MKSWFLQRAKNTSTNRKIFRAALIIGVLTLVAKCGAMIKELVVARSFGREDALDAFLIALVLPMTLTGLVAGSFSGALVPVYIRLRENQGDDSAQRLFSSVQVINLLLLVLVVVLLAAGAPYYLPLLGSGFGAAKLLLTRHLLFVLLPFIVFNGVAAVYSCVLNAHERFAVAAVTPGVTPIICFLALSFLGRHGGIFVLAGGTVLGAALETIILMRAVQNIGMRTRVRWYGFSPELRTVFRQYLPTLLGSLVLGLSPLIDQSMAAMLSPGSVSALSYGNKIVLSIVALTSAALGTAVLPYFSQTAAKKDWSGLRHTLKVYMLLVLSVTIPLTIALMAGSRPLVRLVFQRGAFTAADTAVVAFTQMFFALLIPFATWGTLYVRVLFSLHRSDVLAYCSVLSVCLNIVFNIIFMRIWGVAGIALSSAVVCAAACFFMRFQVFRLLGSQESQSSAVLESPGQL